MALSICTTCLSRLRLAEPTTRTITSSLSALQASPFHSTSISQNVVQKKKTLVPGMKAPKLRESRNVRIKRKAKERPRPPAIGERRAQLKRIVLSNTNALEVEGLEVLSAENMGDESKVGKVLRLGDEVVDSLREAKAFRPGQGWDMFRAPSTLVRGETVQLGREMKGVEVEKGTVVKVVNGERGVGKSLHLLQAMSLAYANKWVVVNVPECQDYVINNSPYAPVQGTEGAEQMYNQPRLASELLARLASSNADVLSELKLTHDHKSLPSSRTPITTIHDLALLGANDQSTAPQIWSAVYKELTSPSRPPLLIAIDGLDHWMGPTKYRSADYTPIHAHQFTLVRQFLDLIFSKTANTLPNGGVILAATTASNNPIYPTFQILQKQLLARAAGVIATDPSFPLPGPYSKPDPRITALFSNSSNTHLLTLKGLTRPESKGLLEYFAKSGIFTESAVDERTVNEKWSLSGGGVIGELCRIGGRVRLGGLFVGQNMGSRLRA